MRNNQNKIVAVAAFGVVLAAFLLASAQQPRAKAKSVEGVGILLMAHGGSQSWNEEVFKVAAEVNKNVPTEVALGMASKRTLQEGTDKLIERGVKQIVAVPLFVSSHSSVITSTEYLLGLRKDAPADLAAFARMDHSHHMSGGSMMNMDPSGPATPVKSRIPIRMTAALDHDPVVAEILLDRANSISAEPRREVVILVAHGPVPDDDNVKWLEDMKILASLMSRKSAYKRIEYQTLRDDAPDPVRSRATAELRVRVEKASGEGYRVLIVPILLSYGGIEQGLKKRLDGLDYTISRSALLPDERLSHWVTESALNGVRSQE